MPPHDACCPLHSPQLNANNVTMPNNLITTLDLNSSSEGNIQVQHSTRKGFPEEERARRLGLPNWPRLICDKVSCTSRRQS